MGIYDRDYYRPERPGLLPAVPRSAVVTLILINVAVFLAEAFYPPAVEILSAHVGTLTQPWLWWQFLTYGFVHDPNTLAHILFNMFTLWVLGRDVEQWYGTKEFLRLYLVMLVVGSVGWALINAFYGGLHTRVYLMGASGAVTGVVVLFALLFPRRMLLFMFVIPMPAWVAGIIMVVLDMLGATGWTRDAGVAHSVHLTGAAFAFLYYQRRWNFGRLLTGRFRWPRLKRPSHLRIHRPEETEIVPDEEVDRILEKIHREGENSLTRKERRFLENASREYQRRRMDKQV